MVLLTQIPTKLSLGRFIPMINQTEMFAKNPRSAQSRSGKIDYDIASLLATGFKGEPMATLDQKNIRMVIIPVVVRAIGLGTFRLLPTPSIPV